MKITVKHDVPYDAPRKDKCLYADGTTFEGDSLCSYHAFRDREHGRKRPADRHCPKCTLFNTWLDAAFVKCTECIQACKESEVPHA